MSSALMGLHAFYSISTSFPDSIESESTTPPKQAVSPIISARILSSLTEVLICGFVLRQIRNPQIEARHYPIEVLHSNPP